jgi:hypothetical protein
VGLQREFSIVWEMRACLTAAAARALLVLAGPLLLAWWWSRPARDDVMGGGDEQSRGGEAGEPAREKQAGDEPRRAAADKDERRRQKAERKEASSSRARAAAEGKLAELAARLNAALASSRSGAGAEQLVLASVDVEAFEGSANLVTEIGLAFFHVAGGPMQQPYFRHRHFIVEEHLALRNGRFVEDNRDRFLYGDSEVLPLEQGVARVAAELAAADYIVGHAISNDLKWLRSLGVSSLQNPEGQDRALQDRVVDTQVLAVGCLERDARESGTTGSGAGKQRSLKSLATEYNLNPAALHNGANDAAFTLQVMLSQCRIPFDPPSRTPSTHLSQPAIREKQAIADAVTGAVNRMIALIEDAGRPPELQALSQKVALFAEALKQGTAVSDPQVGMPELRFPPTLSPQERRCVHEAAALHGLSSCSQGSGQSRYISVRQGGASFPVKAPPQQKSARKRQGKPVEGAQGAAKRR